MWAAVLGQQVREAVEDGRGASEGAEGRKAVGAGEGVGERKAVGEWVGLVMAKGVGAVVVAVGWGRRGNGAGVGLGVRVIQGIAGGG